MKPSGVILDIVCVPTLVTKTLFVLWCTAIEVGCDNWLCANVLVSPDKIFKQNSISTKTKKKE